MELKASSIYFSLVIILLSSLFLGALLNLFTLQHRFAKKIKQQRTEIQHLEEVWSYATHTKSVIYEQATPIILGNDTLRLSKKKWGVLDLIDVQLNERRKLGLVTNENKKDSLALLVATKQALAIAGKTKIVGDVSLSKQSIKRGYVGKIGYLGKELVQGKITTENEQLPTISKKIIQTIQILVSEIPFQQEEQFEELIEPLSNSFKRPTMVYQFSSPIYVNQLIEGNVILQAPKIVISKHAVVNKALFVANEILVEEEAIISGQLIANQFIKLHPNVELHYPSSIFLQSDKKSQLVVDKGCIIEGAVTHISNNVKSITELHENTQIEGQLYSSASTQLKGNVYGSTYVNKFHLKTPSTNYKNYLYNVELNKSKQSEYIELSVLENNCSTKRNVIQWLE